MEIDLNCDLGEGCSHDEELLQLVTSANVACGYHAGNAATALATARFAARHDVRIGAHPGFADREHFGRRELSLPPEHIYAECLYQVGALAGIARSVGRELSHIKPHGALYNMACRDAALARPVIAAAEVFGVPIMALPGSQLEKLSAGRLPFVAEGFADRRYLPDGSLTPRSQPDAVLTDAAEAVRQALWLVRAKKIATLCVHGDNPHALAFVRELRSALAREGIAIRPFSRP